MKALLAGVDPVRPMFDLASGAHSQAAAAGRSGVRSRQLLLTVLGATREQGTRRAAIRAFAEAVCGHGVYAGAIEELTQLKGDPLAALPVTIAMVSTLR